MILTGKSGKRYETIEPAIGKGGEGSVYRISSMPKYVLKVFIDRYRTETRHRKLLTMVSSPLSNEALQQVTWPIDVVYENGQFVGYVMPAICNNEDLNVMYSDKYTCTFTEKIIIARNLCVAINAVHNAGQVCGDLNPKNIGVDPQSARVTLMDTDSYHITEKNGGRVYRCEVGLPEYLTREILDKMKNGQTLVNAALPTFSKNTDLFALAVHIFALLMNGCHPFACATNQNVNINHLSISQISVVNPQPIDNICSGFFPFSQKKSGITTPRYAPEFDLLPKEIQDLFIRAFVNGHSNPSHRPNAVEWYNALSNMEKNLAKCGNDKKHMYPKHLSKCPWCELEQKLKQPIIPPNYQKQNIQQTKINNTNMTSSITNSNTSSSIGTKIYILSNKTTEAEIMFWIVTALMSLGIQAAVHILSDNMIVRSIFGTEYGTGIEYWGTNLAVWLGPWGFVICGLIGLWIYNTQWNTRGRIYGYTWYHYILSVLCSIAFSAGWILLIFILSLAIMLIVGAIIIMILCGVLSGS